ncbi:MAG: type I 3-dehydroquinate dehydratase [Selenomonadales bacterium]|nr:type I 3-dehydroquinate dehydratase [Selenomonadales bacterium]
MRIPVKQPLLVRGTLIGGQEPLVCVPLVAMQREALLTEAREACQSRPDLLEWRADYLTGLLPADVAPLLAELRGLVGETPLIFTYRSPQEGGRAPDDLTLRLQTVFAALASPNADIVDFELASGPEAVQRVRHEASKQDKKLLLSWHNFATTPDESFILSKLHEARQQGADIAKVAVMPNDARDVLTLLAATLAARQAAPDMPLITMSMGALGAMSRVFGGNFGSDVTFARGQSGSAPGQIPIAELRSIWRLLP